MTGCPEYISKQLGYKELCGDIYFLIQLVEQRIIGDYKGLSPKNTT